MKKLLFFTALQFSLTLAWGSSLDNKKIIGNNFYNAYLIIPASDGYLLVTRGVPSVVVRINHLNQVQWSKTYDWGEYVYQVFDAGVLADGGFYLIYEGADEINPEQVYYAVMKLNEQGVTQWTKRINLLSALQYRSRGVARLLPDGGLLFVPSMYSEMAVIKLNANGSIVSSFVMTGDSTEIMGYKAPGMDAEATSDGGMMFVGKNQGGPVIARIGPNGNAVWMRYFFANDYARPYSIIQTSDKNYVIAGLLNDLSSLTGNYSRAWLMKIDTTGNILWKHNYSAIVDTTTDSKLMAFSQLAENTDGTLIATGIDDDDGHFGKVPVLVKFTSTGEILSVYGYGKNIIGSTDGTISRIYTLPNNEKRISSVEFDTVGANVNSILIDPAQIPDYCRAFPFQITRDTMPDVQVLPTNIFTIHSPLVAMNIVIAGRDTTVNLVFDDLCGFATSSAVEEITSVSHNLTFFPNPASSRVTMQWNNNENEVSQFVLRDISGRVVKQVTVNTGTATFDVSELLSGLYIVEVRNAANEKLGMKKLVVE